MNIGMLWYDNDPKATLTEKVERAAEYYLNKYGSAPDLCMVNPKMLSEGQFQTGKIIVRPQRTIMPGHLWIGKDEKLPVGAD